MEILENGLLGIKKSEDNMMFQLSKLLEEHGNLAERLSDTLINESSNFWLINFLILCELTRQ